MLTDLSHTDRLFVGHVLPAVEAVLHRLHTRVIISRRDRHLSRTDIGTILVLLTRHLRSNLRSSRVLPRIRITTAVTGDYQLTPHLPVPGDRAEVAVGTFGERDLGLVVPLVRVVGVGGDVEVDVVVVARCGRVEGERVRHSAGIACGHAVVEDDRGRAGLRSRWSRGVLGHAVAGGPGEDLLLLLRGNGRRDRRCRGTEQCGRRREECDDEPVNRPPAPGPRWGVSHLLRHESDTPFA